MPSSSANSGPLSVRTSRKTRRTPSGPSAARTSPSPASTEALLPLI